MPRLLRLIPALAVAWSLSACGRTVTVGPGRTLHLSVAEYDVQPQSVRVPTGPVRIVVRDTGHLVHNLAVLNNGLVAAATPPIRPGASATLVVALGPGTYVLTSTLFFDQSLGTYGTLRVTR